MFSDSAKLLEQEALSEARVERLLTEVGFHDWQIAHRRLSDICPDDACREHLGTCLPMLLTALSDVANPDGSLINFERFVQAVPNKAQLFLFLSQNPRAVEILIKLFVGSQFLTEILLRNPGNLEKLTQHSRLADFKSREDFCDEAHRMVSQRDRLEDKFNALRRFQRWELLRIGACDAFRLMDLKSVTVQLSLLADSVVQTCLSELRTELAMSCDGFAVIAFGKLGGEELNYSSDIDLVFVADSTATQLWPLGQRLINTLIKSTSEGFLYRTDMRLRPWGRSGPLVVSVDAYLDYLMKDALLWEKQALLKARVIAGDFSVGTAFLQKAEPYIFDASIDDIRASVREMKTRIEANLDRKGRIWGEVKLGAGSIRDIEFVTQFLQLAHGGRHPQLRSFNTLDSLVRLAEFGFLRADEYRQLSTGYVFLRTVEHSLQLMHNKQTHSLPEDPRELAYLARRLDFSTMDQFLSHYEQHCAAVRAVYARHIEVADECAVAAVSPVREPGVLVEGMEPSYAETFSDEEIERHRLLLGRLNEDNIVEVETTALPDGQYRLTVVGFDQIGDLSMICGLLFVYGFEIIDGHVFTAEQVPSAAGLSAATKGIWWFGQEIRARCANFDCLQYRATDRSQARPNTAHRQSASVIVDVFTVRRRVGLILPEAWERYQNDLAELMRLAQTGGRRAAQGQLAKLVPMALRQIPEVRDTLLPVDIDIDNDSSERFSVLRIRAEDTMGFLYELTNALTLVGINIVRVTVSSSGTRLSDVLYVSDESGHKITEEKRQKELRAAIVLIKHFTHLVPKSPNPESALIHFGDFLEQLFQQPNWHEEIASLEQSDVLDALAKLLGVSTFLWEDFLRLQHANLFPIVKNVRALECRKMRQTLEAELRNELEQAADSDAQRERLNAFKDRELFRVDMRHILGQAEGFGRFSAELTDVAEVVVTHAYRICRCELEKRYGVPQRDDGYPCPISLAALGKCGGRELGFASDIELMFVFERPGKTTGPDVISATEFVTKLVELFMQTIAARRAGIFQIDLRLRPYGQAGSLAVSIDAFRTYFAPSGAAWPYERQALVKLRPIAGDRELGHRLTEWRDTLVYRRQPFDVTAMRAMREKQIRQLVQPGTFNAKLSPGGLVDSEYLVQGLQMMYGDRDPTLRTTNTLEAMDALRDHGILSTDAHRQLRQAYIFQRRLIDALRMVRGDARDLAVPDVESEEFEFLARRLGYRDTYRKLQQDLEHTCQQVIELGRLFDEPGSVIPQSI